ncbi:unnamed protein product [Scytosiphon promiscuus]
MGRGQLKYRKRGGRGGGGPPSGGRGQSDRGGSENNSAGGKAGAPAPSRTKRRGGGHDTSHLPSNTERWGQTFGEQQQQGHGGVSSSSSKVGFQETERLLDESEWATGASSWRMGATGEQGTDESDWDSSTSAAAQKLLSLDLGVLEMCLRRLPVHERIRLPADYTAQLEAERQREDPALEPVPPVAVLPPERGEGAEGAATTVTRGRETGAPGTTSAPPAASAPGAIGVGDDGGDDGVLDALLGLPSTGVPAPMLGETGALSGGGRKEGLSPAPRPTAAAATAAAAATRGVATAATRTATPATALQAMQGRGHAPGGHAACVSGSPADATVEVMGVAGERAEVGSGGGGGGDAGGADFLEDWLDGMLAES